MCVCRLFSGHYLTGYGWWEQPLVDVARSVLITYEGKNGRQYVAIMAGGGNVGSTGPGRLYVYTLPRE